MKPDKRTMALQTAAQALEAHRAGDLAKAERGYRAALKTDPGCADALHFLGVLLIQRKEPVKGVHALREAARLAPVAAHHTSLGLALLELGRAGEALAPFQAALALTPDQAQAHFNLGCALGAMGRLAEAAAAYRVALERQPGMPGALTNLGNALVQLGRTEEGAAALHAALKANGGSAAAHFNLGTALLALGRTAEAEAAFRAALARDPGHTDAWYNLGAVLTGQARHREAAACYGEVLARRPDHIGALAQRLHAKQNLCDWNGLEEDERRVAEAAGTARIAPFVTIALEMNAAQRRAVAERWAADIAVPPVVRPAVPAADGRLRIGYLSADFHEHATAYLLAEVLERHDRARFAVTAYSLGPDDGSPMRARLTAAVERFADLSTLPDDEAASRIAAEGIDLLVDLKGYTQNARTGILARRPAPVQINWLGFPGTMGADFIDAMIADPVVVPPGDEQFYRERIVRLPVCYQPNDGRRVIAKTAPSRAACGLPEDGFVFCSFNNAFKIGPALFDVWMRLLTRVPGSVLWLLDANPEATANLRREAAARGVAPERLVFAPRVPLADHLARHRHAGLFLDTLPCNAHTTASDALWAGLPLVTCLGGTFAGRVAASLLHAVGLPQLAAADMAGYEALALRLATDPEELAAVRQTLAANRATAPLFDSARFTRDLEAAFETLARG